MRNGEAGIRGLACFIALALAGVAPGAAAQQQSQPAAATSSTTTAKPAPSSTTRAPAAKPAKKIDLNNATLDELKTLPTVGDAEAKKIIANRPYKSKGELVTKAGLPEGVYQAVRHQVELQTPRKTAAKK